MNIQNERTHAEPGRPARAAGGTTSETRRATDVSDGRIDTQMIFVRSVGRTSVAGRARRATEQTNTYIHMKYLPAISAMTRYIWHISVTSRRSRTSEGHERTEARTGRTTDRTGRSDGWHLRVVRCDRRRVRRPSVTSCHVRHGPAGGHRHVKSRRRRKKTINIAIQE